MPRKKRVARRRSSPTSDPRIRKFEEFCINIFAHERLKKPIIINPGLEQHMMNAAQVAWVVIDMLNKLNMNGHVWKLQQLDAIHACMREIERIEQSFNAQCW